MAGTTGVHIRVMSAADYEQVYELWMGIRGFAIRSVDDSKENVIRFIRRNPKTSVVAVLNGQIVGSILCGHDGRRGCFYHVCVAPDYRQQGIGERMAKAALKALKDEGISKVNLLAFKRNEAGNAFWHSLGWQMRTDINYYETILNEENITQVVQ